MTCLSRTDENKNIFKEKNQKAKKRWNFFAEIDIKDGVLLCQTEKYPLDYLCDKSKWKQKCTFRNGETYEINPR